jgi:hypothetical protein
MTAGRRWWIVILGVVALVLSPVLVRALPVPDRHVSAAALLARAEHSRTVSFSGYAESVGSVALPVDDALSGVTPLLAGTNRVRVWWRDPSVWRTATVRPTGETDLVHAGRQTLRWVYESKSVTTSPDVPVRLPTAVDLLPHELARRLLSAARASELSRVPARRVAGRDAPGLRLSPADPQAAISRVDVYVDRGSGVPLEVDVYARGGRHPVLTSRFLDFHLGRPAPAALRFRTPADARVRQDEVVDLAAAVDEFGARVPPRSLAGLPPRGLVDGSVGVYGRGPTVLLAIPLWTHTADGVRRDLARQPGVQRLHQGLLLAAAPVRLLLADAEPDQTRWLLVGTVTLQALTDAADQLVADRPERVMP